VDVVAVDSNIDVGLRVAKFDLDGAFGRGQQNHDTQPKQWNEGERRAGERSPPPRGRNLLPAARGDGLRCWRKEGDGQRKRRGVFSSVGRKRPPSTPVPFAANEILVLCHGGPIAEPADAQYILDHTGGVVGFYGASSMERLPVEPAISSRVREFTQLRCKPREPRSGGSN